MACLPNKTNFAINARSRILIEAQTVNATDTGGQTITWNSIGTFWAMAEPLNGKEIFAQMQLQSVVTHRFTIRYLSQLKNTANGAKYKITMDNRTFNIKAIKNLDNNRQYEGTYYQEIMAEETAIEFV